MLRDTAFSLLSHVPSSASGSVNEVGRLYCIKVLAYPCGLIRGFLKAAGYTNVVVSCDFNHDGKNVDHCCFNITISA